MVRSKGSSFLIEPSRSSSNVLRILSPLTLSKNGIAWSQKKLIDDKVTNISYMLTIFYIFFSLNIIHELINIVQPNYVHDIVNKIKSMPDLESIAHDQKPEVLKEYAPYLIAIAFIYAQQILYMIETVLGLFTHQWYLFTIFLVISIVWSIITKDSRSRWYARCDSIISAGLIILIIINR